MKLSLLSVLLLTSFYSFAQQKLQLLRKESSSIQCFAGLDTLKASRVKGCYNSFYKVIGQNYVLAIKLDSIPRAGRCLTVNSTPASRRFSATLYVFSSGNAHLGNICSDVVIVNAPIASRKLTSATGQILIGNNVTVRYYGMEPDRAPISRVSILIKSLIFYDSKTHKQIVLKDELFWRVLNELNEQG